MKHKNDTVFLELSHVRKEFGTAVAVQDFNLNINKGEFISFLGPSGCGKTTVLRMVAGFERPTQGTIIINGHDVTNIPANKRNIGMVFQQYALFPNMTVADNIQFGLKVSGADRALRQQRVQEMLGIIRMGDFANRFPHQLSGGQQQRVALARALAIQPDVLLLDEPLSALDAKIRVSLRQEIRAIQRELGITTIFVTHDQEEALSISDRIVVMNQGNIEQLGTPLDIYNRPQTQFVASFIGSLNVLQGSVQDASAGRITIDDQPVQTDESLTALGSAISIALRPESINLNAANGHTNQLNATVEDIYFLGSVVRIRTRLNSQFINVDTFNNPAMELPRVGEAVTLNFSTEAAKVLHPEGAASVHS
jgi:putative spermidine/putrescine transport system ATP-binding protein